MKEFLKKQITNDFQTKKKKVDAIIMYVLEEA